LTDRSFAVQADQYDLISPLFYTQPGSIGISNVFSYKTIFFIKPSHPLSRVPLIRKALFRERGTQQINIAAELFRVRFEIRRMLFPVKETFVNTIAFELFRVRFEIGKPVAKNKSS
jgi:hypothetical protein